MKKLSVLAVVAMVFALAACSSSTSGSKDTTGPVDTIVGDTTPDLGTLDTTPDTTADVPKDGVNPEDTIDGCLFCSPWQTCENNACKDPATVDECPYGGNMISTDCQDVDVAGCCSSADLYYCESGQGCPNGEESCLCKLDCATNVAEDGTPMPFCGYYDAAGYFVCMPEIVFPDPALEIPTWCSWYTCTPDCEGKACGPDGCGGECGTCDSGFLCDEAGTCAVCTPECTDKVCGDNGCGGECGTCDEGQECLTDGSECITPISCGEAADCQFACPPDDDACNTACYDRMSDEAEALFMGVVNCLQSDCWTTVEECMAEGGVCYAETQACYCVADCTDKTCGDNGCGGVCGPDFLCADDQICAEDQASCIDAPACDPADCAFPWQVCRHGECVDPTVEGEYCGTGGYLLGEDCHGVAEVGCCAGAPSYYCGTAANEQCPEGMDTCLCALTCGSAGKVCGWDPLALDGHMNCLASAVSAPEDVDFSCPGYTCVPDCVDKDCGYDGCGGICGTCTGAEECTAENKCCASDCAADGGERICGMNPCGTNCGTCKEGLECTEEGKCKAPCVPACTGKDCGDNGCGGVCGNCTGTDTCEAGVCTPVS